MARHRHIPLGVALLLIALAPSAAAQDLKAQLTPAIQQVEEQVVAWRRDIHQHPELSNRETRTAALVAEHLRGLGLEVDTGVAHTGVVGILRGGRPGPVVALRADMDALPVVERTGLPFASTATTVYDGQEVGVMHACGHDAHTAILMGVAEVLAGMRDDLPGTVKFIFQPAEEGAPAGEEGGASMMIEEGVLGGAAAPEAIFALHVVPMPVGQIGYRTQGTMAASDELEIVVAGEQTHGSQPWNGVDPVIAAGQLMTALQLIPSRHLDLTTAPAVISIGRIQGGVRGNIIPDSVRLVGTIRTFDTAMRDDLHRRLRATATAIAESHGATATVTIDPYAPVVYNDPDLTRQLLPTLEWAAGADQVVEVPATTGAEDFAFFLEEIPGVYFFLGVNEEGVSPEEAAPNHSPYFYVNEDALVVGVRALAGAAVDYLAAGQ